MGKTAIFTTFIALTVIAASSVTFAEQDSTQTEARLHHARELLGKSYQRSAVRKSESTEDMTDFVREATKKFLAKKYRKSADAIAKAIVESADRYELDPVFVMAVIQNESSFNPIRRGSFGEIGLMQVKPDTAKWIADTYELEYYGKKTLLDPVQNIQIGTALLDKLRHQFESESRLYLSAYNAGAKKVRNLAFEHKTPKDYVIAVMKRYIALYSAFKVEGNWKMRGEIAFLNTRSVTMKKLKIATNP